MDEMALALMTTKLQTNVASVAEGDSSGTISPSDPYTCSIAKYFGTNDENDQRTG